MGDRERPWVLFSVILTVGECLHNTGEIRPWVRKKALAASHGQQFYEGLGDCLHLDPGTPSTAGFDAACSCFSLSGALYSFHREGSLPPSPVLEV